MLFLLVFGTASYVSQGGPAPTGCARLNDTDRARLLAGVGCSAVQRIRVAHEDITSRQEDGLQT